MEFRWNFICQSWRIKEPKPKLNVHFMVLILQFLWYCVSVLEIMITLSIFMMSACTSTYFIMSLKSLALMHSASSPHSEVIVGAFPTTLHGI